MSTRAKKDDATHRLEDMTTQEVSLVDRAANLRTFLTLKSEDNNTMPTEDKSEQNKSALVLPTQARDTLIEGVADALEKLTGVTQAIKESTTDDSAEVPSEMPQMIKEAGELLSKLAAKFMDGESAGSDDASGDSSDDAGNAETEKAKAALVKFAETAKGRRMTASREEQMKEAFAAFIAVGDALGVDLKEVFAPAPAAEGDDAGETAKSDATVEVLTSLVAAINGVNAKVDALAKSADDKTSKQVDDLTSQLAELKKSLAAPGESNSVGAEGDEPKSEPKPFTWPSDMAAHVAKKQAAEAAGG